MFDYIDRLLRANGYAPHGYCLLWQPELIWTHVLADALIAAAYFSIPVALVFFVRTRKDVVFGWVFWCFALFIMACGSTHIMSIWTLWHSDYGLEALVKVATAAISVATAIALWPLLPKALAIPSPQQLALANDELAARVSERDVAIEQLQAEILERQRAEDALRQAQKMDAVGQLTGGIAHDFNNLLQVMAGSLDLIRRNAESPDRVSRFAANGLQAAERATKLTGQLLAFSRTQKLELQSVLVEPLIVNMQDLLARTLGPGVLIETDLDGENMVAADPNQLELAILNLAINARDAMPEGGQLKISTARVNVTDEVEVEAGDYLQISVTDTGTGMMPEVLARAAEPFFTTKEVGKGTGLGLSTVYGIARQSGGTVRLESEPGEGTIVNLLLRRLPAPAMDAPTNLNDDWPERGKYVRPATILVVDDDDEVRTNLTDSLTALGHQVIAAADGKAALAALQAREPDLMLLDFAMPGMNGAEVARRVRERWPVLPIVFASGYADTAALEAAIGRNTPMLRKPFTIDQLSRILSRELGRAA